MWTVRRSFDAMIKIQHRLTGRAQQMLHDQLLNALVAVGGLVDLFSWVSMILLFLFFKTNQSFK